MAAILYKTIAFNIVNFTVYCSSMDSSDVNFASKFGIGSAAARIRVSSISIASVFGLSSNFYGKY